MYNLNKENFWDNMMKKYPDAVKNFCEWIDIYKIDVKWNDLFNEGYHVGMHNAKIPKFHDVPLEMQLGILMRWYTEFFLDKKLTVHFNFAETERIVEGWLEQVYWVIVNSTPDHPQKYKSIT